MSNFVVPNTGKKKNENIQILEAGPNPGILYAIVDEGTHYNAFFKKSQRTLRLIFEFPLLKQLFMEGDTELKPTVVSQEYTFVLAEKSNLKKNIIDGAEGRVLAPHEYRDGWNIGQYLGRTFMVDIVNKPNKKDPTKIHNNIGSIKALSDSLKAKYNFNWEEVTRTNELVSFMIDPEGTCFASEEYIKLPPYLRKKTRESDEGRAYEQAGGVFAEREKTNGNGNGQSTPPPAKPQTPANPNAPIKTMLVDDFTYEEYIAGGWTDAQLVEHGKMTITQPKAEAPKPQAPAPNNPPQSPTPPNIEVEDEDIPF